MPASTPDFEKEPWIRCQAKKEVEYLAHRGPIFLAKILAIETLKERRKAIDKYGSSHVFERFNGMAEYPIPSEGLVFPANKYLGPDILTKLSLMPESEQPSHGWRWFCGKYNVETLGVGPPENVLDSWLDLRDFCTERVLRWGFPLWDEEKVKQWETLNEGEAAGELFANAL